MTKNLSEIFSLVVASENLATRPSQGVGPGPRNRALTEEQCISITAVNKVRILRIELAPKTCGSKETPDPMEGSHYGG
jgi:hypothetical protein